MGGPPQHSTWDPKPDAPAEIRGPFKPIATSVPGMQIGELMPAPGPAGGQARHPPGRLHRRQRPLVQRLLHDDGLSASADQLRERQPRPAEQLADPGGLRPAPAQVGRDRAARRGPPAQPHLQHRRLGLARPGRRPAGPRGRPLAAALRARLAELSHPGVQPVRGRAARPAGRPARPARARSTGASTPPSAAAGRGSSTPKRSRPSTCCARIGRAGPSTWTASRKRCATRYGRSQFGQSVLLARRLVEAGVSLVQVNWYRGPNEPSDNPCWDSHANEGERLKTVLLPPTDQAFSALLDDLSSRGMLDETLVVCLSEFGRTPKMNGRAGRDHWGHVFSVALAGGGIRGGQVHGASDKIGGHPEGGARAAAGPAGHHLPLPGLSSRHRGPRHPGASPAAQPRSGDPSNSVKRGCCDERTTESSPR